MSENKSENLPRFKSLDELADFFDTHDMGEYWEQMPEVRFDINIRKRGRLIAVNEELAGRLTEIAESKQIPPETLVELWLKEKISESYQRKKSSQNEIVPAIK